MAALKRFCSRRGTPKKIHSDKGTNFVGAKKELQRIQQLICQSKNTILHHATANYIEWKFIPQSGI